MPSASKTELKHIPANLITGFLGVGKTTAILELLKHKPPDQRWAVLVNEFGEVGIDGAALEAGSAQGVTIREVPGGCLCCAAQVTMRVALTRLLRDAHPSRLLIEPTGLGHLAGVIDTLREPYFCKVLDVRATVCLVDPRQFADAAIARTPAYQDQLTLADVLVANKTDLATPDELHRFLANANTLYPPKLLIEQTRRGKLDPEWLDIEFRPDRIPAHPDAHADENAGVPDERSEPAGPFQRRINKALGNTSCGWVFPPETLFDLAGLRKIFAHLNRPGGLRLGGLVRAKGVLRTGREWRLVNWSEGDTDFRPIAYRRDSRIEIIVYGDFAPQELAAFETALGKAIKPSPGQA